MKTMTWEEIDKDWAGLQRRHRMEIGEAVARYCIGHSMKEVAKHLGYTVSWVAMQLDFAGTCAALGGPASSTPLAGKTGTNVQKELPRLVQEFKPDVDVSVVNAGTDQEFVELDGDDADDFQPIFDKYYQQGHEVSAATRLANAEMAAEAAVDAGAIQERTKDNKKVNQILFGDDRNKTTFELDLQLHMSRVKSASSFLDKANMADLKRAATRDKVADADAAWRFQMERMQNFHPTLKGE